MYKHVSVLLNESIVGLQIKPDGVYVDCTLGGAGHSKEIYKRLTDSGKLIGIDQDAKSIEACLEIFKSKGNVQLVHDNFANIKDIFSELGLSGADGFLLDLGVSSHQLDEAERGFSYMQDAPLDMRMNRDSSFSAMNVVNEYDVDSLNRIIWEYGEERWAKRIAQFIVADRKIKPIETTLELVSAIKAAVPKGARYDGPHPAKRTFQAVRIEVNRELEILDQTIRDMTTLLKPSGRICIITFHSLEDRIVKQAFRSLENPCVCPRDFPMCMCGKKPSVKVVTRKPVLPDNAETEENSRARSAKLRIAEKI